MSIQTLIHLHGGNCSKADTLLLLYWLNGTFLYVQLVCRQRVFSSAGTYVTKCEIDSFQKTLTCWYSYPKIFDITHISRIALSYSTFYDYLKYTVYNKASCYTYR